SAASAVLRIAVVGRFGARGGVERGGIGVELGGLASNRLTALATAAFAARLLTGAGFAALAAFPRFTAFTAAFAALTAAFATFATFATFAAFAAFAAFATAFTAVVLP